MVVGAALTVVFVAVVDADVTLAVVTGLGADEAVVVRHDEGTAGTGAGAAGAVPVEVAVRAGAGFGLMGT